MSLRYARAAAVVVLAALLPACGVGGGGGGTLTPTVAPATPTGLRARSGNRQLLLSWSPSPAAGSYTVRRSALPGGPYLPVGETGSTSLLDTGLANGTSYYYTVSAANAYGRSADSDEQRGVPGLKARTIAAGASHTLAILTDGSLWSWGSNQFGQLGTGAEHIASDVAVPVDGIPDAVAISAGSDFSLALREDGTVWAWGMNHDGQLGRDNLAFSAAPQPVPGLTDITAIAAGDYHALARRRDGTVWAWGRNTAGEAGILGAPRGPEPVQVAGITDVVAVAAGWGHSLALRSDGSVWGWGSSQYGQIGTVAPGGVPGPISNLTGITSIAAGWNTCYAIDRAGTAWTWGSNDWTKLGIPGDLQFTRVPAPLALRNVVAIDGGGFHSVAVLGDGTVWVWGFNRSGVYGDGTLPPTVSTLTPGVLHQVPGLTGVTGLSVGYEYCMTLQEDGTILGWGDSTFGQVGGGVAEMQPVPVTVSGVTNAVATSAGDTFSVAVQSDGSVWAWGSNLGGQLGNKSTTDSPYRVNVLESSQPLSSVTAVACGSAFTLALKSDGTVRAWGANGYGQLGNNTITDRTYADVVPGLSGTVRIGAGHSHALAVRSDGTIRSWGFNAYGMLGNGTLKDSRVPVTVTGMTGATAAAGGLYHSLALRNDGTVWAWGENSTGALGTGTTTSSSVPVQVSGLAGIVAIAAGWIHNLALRDDGTVWAWGANDDLQLGRTGIDYYSTLPVQVVGLQDIVAVGAGYRHSVALRRDGTVWSWGSNVVGQLGGSGLVRSAVPRQAEGVSGAVAISVGGSRTLAINPDGTLSAWGSNWGGGIGIGTTSPVLTPIEVAK